MDKYVFETLCAWALARQSASQNTTLLLESSTRDVSAECTRRMETLNRRTLEIMELDGRQDLPIQLVRYIETRLDLACVSCRISSSGPIHEECRQRNDAYFRTEEELLRFTLTMMVDK